VANEDMKVTFDAKDKVNSEVHALDLEQVPALPLGATQHKADDVDSPTVASSVPSTPLKSANVSDPSVSKTDSIFKAFF
jgi:hypothetical protein